MKATPSWIAVLALGIGAFGVASCGEDSGESKAAIEQRIERERQEAARLARQDERIKQLQAEVKEQKAAAKNKDADQSSRPTNGGTPATPTRPAASSNSGDWPGGPAHTVILASVPSESAARAKQADASALGLDAGVLRSSDFRSLRPGYWVVFSGAFPNATTAAERQSRARSAGFNDAYVRFVSP